MYKNLEIQKSEAVWRLQLNRPEVKNAMNAEMISELLSFFENIDSKCRAIVIKGSGDFYCAGGDLNWMKSSLKKSAKENEEDTLALAQMLHALDECPVPVISLVRGGAFGGGVGLVAGSDIVIADEKALFSLSEVKLGLLPATIGPLVMRKIGMSQARRFYLTGKRFSALEARSIGLVHEVVPVASLNSVCQDYLNELGMAGPQAVKVAKKLIRNLQGHPLWEESVCEKTSKILSEVRIGSEAQEGMTAFLEKRKPSWREDLK
ncbi:MAG: hypothetical protein COV44_04200 [Deltaproteobacteria bacterium CG11_big_fil_rev_8_21_14_0_20_45_16]|nr:MAG: hypothetical protein COV44_04200 [Deltaproteobacteria bacterium CG11_big_fil_rev_8_21_14_0_20_45_16]